MSEIHDAVGSYVVNALDPSELAEFEAHLATCATCTNEVAELCETAAELSLLASTAPPPPPELRTNILAAIRQVQPLPPEEPAERPVAPITPSTTRATPPVRSTGPRRAVPGSEVVDEPPVDELALRRQRRRTRVLTALVAAVMAVAIGLGGVVYTLVQQRQVQVAQTALENQLYNAPDARVVVAPVEGGGQASFVVSKQLNRAMFIGTDLPNPGPDNRYQLWTATGTGLDNLTGVFRDNQVADTTSGTKVFFSGDIAGADFLAVNIEPVGSTPDSPTTAVLAAGAI